MPDRPTFNAPALRNLGAKRLLDGIGETDPLARVRCAGRADATFSVCCGADCAGGEARRAVGAPPSTTVNFSWSAPLPLGRRICSVTLLPGARALI
jgi:hypothetical protein